MLPDKKMTPALGALNWVLVALRRLAVDQPEALPELLGLAEYLPRLLADSSDTSEQYRDVLLDLVRRNSWFTTALERFDGDVEDW